MNLLLELGNFKEGVLGLFYPNVCQYCRTARATAGEGYICTGCRDLIRPVAEPTCFRCGLHYGGAISTSFTCSNCEEAKPQFDSARAAAPFDDLIKEVIHGFKYQRALWFEPFLDQVIKHHIRNAFPMEDWDYLVPIPLHPLRLRERGYNQAEIIAKICAKHLDRPLKTGLVIRTRETGSQTRLSREDRLENMDKVFAMKRPQPIQGDKILLIDDVLTTGATAGSCAAVLKRAGAARVDVWTVARGALT